VTSKNKGNLVQEKHTVALIGLGNVGFGKYLSKRENQILNHYSAITNQESLKLLVCSDKEFIGALKDPFVKNVNEINSLNVDLLVISTPTETHLEVIETFLAQNSAKIILVEKPCTNSIHEINQLNGYLAEYSKTEVLVNYHRNYNDIFIDSFGDESLGKLQCGTVHYSNGALNNASHAMALIMSSIKDIAKIKVIGSVRNQKFRDFDFILENNEGSRVVFLATNESLYSNFRIELDYEHGVVSYDSAKGEVQTRLSVTDPDFINRRNLESVGHVIATNERIGFQSVYNFLVTKLENKEVNPKIGVDLNFAHRIQEIFEEISNF